MIVVAGIVIVVGQGAIVVAAIVVVVGHWVIVVVAIVVVVEFESRCQVKVRTSQFPIVRLLGQGFGRCRTLCVVVVWAVLLCSFKW